MKLRATLRVRNETMLAAREARGWSQTDLARAAGVSLSAVGSLEALDYRRRDAEAEAARMAVALGLVLDAVLPEGLAGTRIWEDRRAVAEADPARLLAAHGARWVLEDPSLVAEQRELVERALACMSTRERRVVESHYLEGRTLEDVARDIDATRERVRQIEARGIRRAREEALR